MQNDFGQRVVGRELFEHGFVGGNAAFGGFFQTFGGDVYFVEQDFLQLFRIIILCNFINLSFLFNCIIMFC